MSAVLDLGDLPTGFAVPVDDSQQVFRSILGAMSRPGGIHRIKAAELGRVPVASAALTACILTLADRDAPIWLSARLAGHPLIASYARFHTGCRIADRPSEASLCFFAGADIADRDLDAVPIGTDEAPHLGATVIVDVSNFATGARLKLTGPGIEIEQCLRVDLPTDRLWAARCALNSAFPRGFDLLMCCGDQLAAIPRSTQVAY